MSSNKELFSREQWISGLQGTPSMPSAPAPPVAPRPERPKTQKPLAEEEEKRAYDERIQKAVSGLRPMNDFKADFEKSCTANRRRISTGYFELDKTLNGGLFNELYILGAETSVGKTAVSMNIAQNIAESGVPVLYFSFEMSRAEFIARGASRLSHVHWKNNQDLKRFTAGDILFFRFDNTAQDFVSVPLSAYKTYTDEYFSRYGKNLYIVYRDIHNGMTSKDVCNIAYKFKSDALKGGALAVFVDYLQLIDSDQNDHSQIDKRNIISNAVKNFKTLASQFEIPVFLISSIGRQKYKHSVSLDAYKESGEIEYTGGVVLGLNWLGVTDEEQDEPRKTAIAKCKEQGYREISIDLLKNRNAERDTGVRFRYYPAYSYIEEESAFRPTDEQTPFEQMKLLTNYPDGRPITGETEYALFC